jgi:hypothetical protein
MKGYEVAPFTSKALDDLEVCAAREPRDERGHGVQEFDLSQHGLVLASALRRERVLERLDECANALEDVYADRNRLVQLAARLAEMLGYEVRWGDDPASPGWPVLYIELPTGQVSWHIPRASCLLRAGTRGKWDGHDSEEKTRRITAFIQDRIEDSP